VCAERGARGRECDVHVRARRGAFAKKSSQAIRIEVGFLVAMSVVMVVVQGIF
jgi:hypothetical protein